MKRSVFVFGEVLFDSFDTGKTVLGGAPFNVAWNLQGFGHTPRFISAVGADEDGAAIYSAMERWQLSREFVQQDYIHGTGRVIIHLDKEGEPQYDILPQRAYDFIPRTELPLEDGDILYYGSLAARSEVSRESLFNLLDRDELLCFCDINIREPWYDSTWGEELLRAADILKVNRDELFFLAGGFTEDIVDAAHLLRKRYEISMIVVTLGEAGAWVVDDTTSINVPAAPVQSFVDPVGAGDAFASVVLDELAHHKKCTKETLQKAGGFAARVCGMSGATCSDRQFYQSY
ncbi:carbohydrate kinase family protein [Chitinivibrio alkaliphilus]|uniref:PfkB domain-containing protein n=1 Tax=Chitinivibrio alkaliphilus ACht1 TaxID=1313304 RepID=U7D8A4_9BACT|nr:carbohydrate kinase [Chitinivibrio alkaliphilus]ERP32173.1 PfkB domain-containing protein [Chitinivibrio alkaliphilus ACht1]